MKQRFIFGIIELPIRMKNISLDELIVALITSLLESLS